MKLQSLLPVRTTELILILLILYLLRTYTYGRLIFISISRRTHIYTYLPSDAYIDFHVCGIELIHILIRRYLSTYSYLYLSQISRRSSQNLCLYRDTYTRTGTYIYLKSHVGVHRTYAYTEILIHVLVLMSISDLP